MRVTIIGTGYVGLVTGAGLAAKGHTVICVDLQPERVAVIARGEPPFYEPGLAELLARARATGRFSASTELAAAVVGSELVLIAVGTPAGPDGIDLSQVVGAATAIGLALRDSANAPVVVVKSTVVPGTTDTLVLEALEAAAGQEVAVGFNPEFLREGSAVVDFMSPDRVVVGADSARAQAALLALYEPFDCPKVVMSTRNAELTKYASNALLATMISFANELAGLCERLPGTDIETVMDALHLDQRLSPVVNGERVTPGITSYLRAGVGYGGSCLPKDVDALRAFARQQGAATPLLDAAQAVNAARPGQVVLELAAALGGLAGRTITVLGLAFKPDTDDLRSSPSFPIIKALLAAGATVRAHDPVAGPAAQILAGPEVMLTDSPERALALADAALIATAWPEYVQWDWERLAGTMKTPVLFDGRRSLRHVALPAFIQYHPIGRVATSAGALL